LKTDVCYVNGEWVKAKSGKTFEVHGKNTLSLVMNLELTSRQIHVPENLLAQSPNSTLQIPKPLLMPQQQHFLLSARRPAASDLNFSGNGTT
jgi:hypothetical protein